MSVPYLFGSGDPLSERFVYPYSPYQGQDFLDAWSASREGALDQIRARSGEPHLDEPEAWPPRDVVEDSDKKGRDLFEIIVKRFEVSKRIYPAYREDGRAADPRYDRLDWYVSFAEVLVSAFDRGSDVRMVNALLKCLDILCAYVDSMDPRLAGRVGSLIQDERRLVRGLDTSVEVGASTK